MDSVFEACLAAEGLDELHGRSERVERRNAQHVGVVNVEHAFIGIFAQKRIEYCPRLLAIFAKNVALLDLLCPFPPSERLAIAGDMANKVKGIEVLAQLFRDNVERQAFGSQRSEEHTSELQSLMRLPYAVFCLKQK